MEIKESVLLREYATYKIGGPARYFCEVKNESDLQEAIKFAHAKDLQIFILGGGSNLIISDDGFDGLVIKIGTITLNIENDSVEAGAGVSMAELVAWTTRAGLMGLEWTGGLPGTLGGAIFGNAGCFGHEIKEIITSVWVMNISGKRLQLKTYSKEACAFSYRNSKFKREGDYVILSAVLKFKRGRASELQEAAQEKIDYRKNRHPLEYPNIGSIFKNIDEKENVQKILARFSELENEVKNKWYGKIPTAVIIEKAGMKGKRLGGIQVSEKHANFLINIGNGRADEVRELIKEIKKKVREMFGIELEEEVRYVGF